MYSVHLVLNKSTLTHSNTLFLAFSPKYIIAPYGALIFWAGSILRGLGFVPISLHRFSAAQRTLWLAFLYTLDDALQLYNRYLPKSVYNLTMPCWLCRMSLFLILVLTWHCPYCSLFYICNWNFLRIRLRTNFLFWFLRESFYSFFLQVFCWAHDRIDFAHGTLDC